MHTPTGDAFITVLNPFNSPPTVALRRRFGGSCLDYATAVRVDPTASFIQIAGYTSSSDFPAASGPPFGGMSDGFLRRMDLLGNVRYSSFLGGSDVDYLYAVDLDAAGDAYVAGYTSSPDFPATGNAVQPCLAGSTDLVAGVYDPRGGRYFTTFFGGTAADLGRGIAFDREAGVAYLTGYTFGTYPTSPGAHRPARGPLREAVVTGLGGITPPNQLHCPIALASDYDNANPQTTGLFRDWTHSLNIFANLDVGGTGHQAINFKNVGNTPGVDCLTLHDTVPADLAADRFVGSALIEADVLVHDIGPTTPLMSRFVGLVALFNEGPGQVGIALLRKDQVAGTDTLNVRLITQSGDTGGQANLAQRNLTTGASDDQWYRLSMRIDVDVPLDSVRITGKLFTHVDPLDPGSPLGPQVDATRPGLGTINYTGSLSALGLDPAGLGQVGIAFDRVNGTTGQASVTNLCFDVTTCGPGLADCNGLPGDGCEVDVRSDLDNCGGCGSMCSGANATASCTNGGCALTCDPGFASCNGTNIDGCEIDLLNDPSNCGTCGNVCGGQTFNCVGGVCE